MDKVKVLIVDDEKDIAYLLSLNLKKKAYATLVARNLAEAEKIIHTEFPPIILLDNHLPDGLGIEYVSEIKKELPLTKIVMITAYDTPQDRQKALNNGVDVFISKPFKVEEIITIVEELTKTLPEKL